MLGKSGLVTMVTGKVLYSFFLDLLVDPVKQQHAAASICWVVAP